MCNYIGSAEVFYYWFIVNLLIVVVIAILSCISFKNVLQRFGLHKINRREFYECGFKPTVQKSIKLSLQFLIICIFFIVYDIELVFSFPLVSVFSMFSLLDFFIFGFLYGTLILSLIFDFNRFLTKWRI